MKVHVKQIPAQGLHLEGEEDSPIQELESEGIRCVGRLRYDLDLGVAGGALWANGSLSQPVELRCVSCLEKFVHEIRVPAFAEHMQLTDLRRSILPPLFARKFYSTSQRIHIATGTAIGF